MKFIARDYRQDTLRKNVFKLWLKRHRYERVAGMKLREKLMDSKGPELLLDYLAASFYMPKEQITNEFRVVEFLGHALEHFTTTDPSISKTVVIRGHRNMVPGKIRIKNPLIFQSSIE